MVAPNSHFLERILVSEKMRRFLFWAFILIVVAVILIWAIQPIRQWIDQREELSTKQQELEEVQRSNMLLQERVEELQTPELVELFARQNFGLIREGEEAYAVLPPAPEPLRIPSSWPFTELADALGG
ncbi:MAG: septum formation initiator family protein [Actinomycetota bacterium]|nr:septum formation initiator family protein [Actinomycetota bacterium]